MKKWILCLIGAAAIGGGLYFWLVGFGVQPLGEKNLIFAEVKRATIRDIVSATGLVEPRQTVFVTSETPGTVVRLLKAIGDPVLEGAELALLDDRKITLKIEEAANGVQLAEAAFLQAEAALAQAQASKSAAERNVKAQKDLEKAGGFRTELEQAEAQREAAVSGVKAAQAGVEVARAKKLAAQTARREAELVREQARIRVPGLLKPIPDAPRREFLILDRKAHEGQMVGPQSGPLFTLAGSLDMVEVHAQVAEGDINKIREHLTALFKVTNYNDEDSEFAGKIKKIRPMASILKDAKGAIYYDAVIEVKNRRDPDTREWQLRPGMTVSVDIVRHEHKNVWRVPAGALNFEMETAYQSAAAQTKIAEWKKRPDEKDWRPLWTWDQATRQAGPVFVRLNPKAGEIALKDAEGNEILEWEPGREPAESLRVIIKAPPAHPPGFFDQPANVKI